MSKLKIFLLIFLVGVVTVLFLPINVSADPIKPAVDTPSVWMSASNLLPSDLANLMKARSWSEAGRTIVPALFNMAFFVTILLCLFLIVRAGFMFILSEGSKENYNKARIALTQAVIGLGLVLSVFLIFNVVQIILGVNLAEIAGFGTAPSCHDLGTCGGKNQ